MLDEVGKVLSLGWVGLSSVLIEQAEEQLNRRYAGLLCLAFDLDRPAKGAVTAEPLPQPLGERALSARAPEGEVFLGTVHCHRGSVADEHGVQVLE
ncbi:hypothetical protein ABT288_20070 [Streptomyces sp. NPDC001093]|uniref:hypothetical protein n=1 Tax=Streptomyces sp. NPDC001093 TaxID=3154376 RepID=UPI0033313138